jgi:putative transcriptional regulator
MTEKPKYASRMLEAVHEGALDLFAGGSIDAARMQQFDELCLPADDVPEPAGPQINALPSPER